MKGFSVNLDYWSLLNQLKNSISIDDNVIDLKKHTEQSYVSLFVTVERISWNADDDEEFLLDLVTNNIKTNRARADIISTRQIKFRKRSQFLYQYHVQMILDKRVTDLSK